MRTGSTLRQRVGARAVAVVVACIVAAGSAACASPRNSLGTSDSPCFQALPTATRAVGGHGRLLGVHLVTLNALRREGKHLIDAVGTGHPGTERVCAAAFEGHFDRSSLTKPHGHPSGTAAVAVVASPSNQLLGTYLFTHVPISFAHPHAG